MIEVKRWMTIRKMHADGVSVSEIARQTGCDRKTVRKHMERETIPLYDKKNKKSSKLDPFKEHINARLQIAPFSAVILFEEIEKMGYQGKLTILKDFIRSEKGEYNRRAVMRFETLPGQQAQVDWGHFGKIEVNGKQKDLYCFLIILGYSRTRFVTFTTSMNIETLLACHIEAFKSFGGVPKEILYDNMKTVVLKRLFKAKDSEMNQKFMDFAGYYGFSPILCRVYRPQTKGKIENAVKFVRYNFFIRAEYISLKDLNNLARAWCIKINHNVHGTTKEKPCDRLKKECLTSIEGRPDYDTSETFYRKVGLDCYVCFDGNKYSAPLKYAGKEVSVRKAVDKPLQFFYRNELICEHIQPQEKGISVTNAKHLELKQEAYRTKKTYRNRKYVRQRPLNDLKVEERPLSVYEQIIREGEKRDSFKL